MGNSTSLEGCCTTAAHVRSSFRHARFVAMCVGMAHKRCATQMAVYAPAVRVAGFFVR